MLTPFDAYRLHHVGVVFPDLAEAETFMEAFELAEAYRGFVEIWSCWCIFTKPIQGAAIELVVPTDGPLLRFNRGAGGVHHYAYEVDDIAAVTARFAAKGMRMLEPEAIRGAGNFLCNFLSPIASRGIQIEFVQPLDRS